MVMLAKGRSLKGCTCTIIGAVVGLSLVLPIFFTGTSLSEKILLDWLMWSKSPDYTVDYAYDYSPSGKLRSSEAVPRGGERCLLKVYVYDFPRRLHLGMLKNTVLDQDLPWTDDETPPVWPLRSGLKKQHNVEYWMMVDLLDRRISRDGDRQVVRVSNPEHADLFFVPFFSSLSFNRYGHYMRDPDTEKDRLLQVSAEFNVRGISYFLFSLANHIPNATLPHPLPPCPAMWRWPRSLLSSFFPEQFRIRRPLRRSPRAADSGPSVTSHCARRAWT